MSYILDALRRADAERERGRVPGLHAQAMPLRTGDAEVSPRQPRRSRVSRTAVVAAALLLLAALAALAWRGLGGTHETGQELPPPAPTSSAVPATPPVASAAPATPPPTASPPSGAPAASSPPILAPAPPPTPPAPPARAATDARQPTPGGDEDIPRVADLPPPARAGLPPLQVSGTTYAENAALRMLIVDGKVLQEGQDIAPGLRLESIGPRSAVLTHQGRRLRLTY